MNIHRGKISELRELIENIGRNPGKINDTDFRHRMSEVNDTVNLLVQDARRAVGEYQISKSKTHQGNYCNNVIT